MKYKLEISNVKMTAINPKINDANPIKGVDNPNKIDKQAPTLAPLDTPKRSGDTNLLLKVLWQIAPLTESDAPTKIAISVVGILKYSMTFEDVELIF